MDEDRVRELELELELRRRRNAQQSMIHRQSMQAKPVKAQGGFMDFLGGIGEGLGDIGRGAKQRVVEARTAMGYLTPEVQDRLRNEESKVRDKRTYDPTETGAAAFGRGIGTTLPSLPLMAFAPGTGLVGSTLSSAGLGALYSSLLPTTSSKETYSNMAMGGVGAGLGNVASRIVMPTGARTMTQAQKDLLDIARRERIPLRTSEATGSAAIKNYEQMAANRPLTAGMEQRFNEEQTRAINRAITRRLGNEVDEVNPQTLQSFGKEIGGRVGQAVQGKQVDLTDDVFNAVVKVDSEFSQGGKLTMTPQIKELIDNALVTIASKQKVSGKVAQGIKSKLQDRMRDAYNAQTPNTELGDALKTIINGMDDAIGNTMTAAERAAWEKARRQYGNYKAVEDIMIRPTRQGAEGDVPVKNLASALERQFSGSYAKGTADLAGVARLGQVIQPPGRSALLGESGFPVVRNAQDLGRAAIMPILQSKAVQNYLTGDLRVPGAGFMPVQSLLRDSPRALRTNDAILRSMGLSPLFMEER
jgi:hypothetical protein